MKKAIVIYDSKFGNTEKIARALAEGLKEKGAKVDSIEVGKVDVDKLVEYDFIAIGGPTHIAGMSESIKEFLEKLKTVDLSGKKGFSFDTRIQSRFNRFDLNSAAKRIERKMKKMKIKIVKSRKSAIVDGREGPLEEGAEEVFKQTGAEIVELIQ